MLCTKYLDLTLGPNYPDKPYAGRRINFRSKTTSIHGSAHKCDLSYSYSISRFSSLLQAVAKKLIYHLSHKDSNAFKIIDPAINEFSPNDESIHLHIYDHSIFTFGIR